MFRSKLAALFAYLLRGSEVEGQIISDQVSFETVKGPRSAVNFEPKVLLLYESLEAKACWALLGCAALRKEHSRLEVRNMALKALEVDCAVCVLQIVSVSCHFDRSWPECDAVEIGGALTKSPKVRW